MTELVQVSGLTRYYGNECAVNQLSFNLKKGEVLGFLGENGAGKTTTLQMLCGVLTPTEGEISICGMDLLKQPQLAKQHIGYLPEHPPLYKELTVDEFLHYCAKLHKLPSSAIQKAVSVAQEKCHLSEVKHRLIGNLSKGYQQRVGIAQAILHQPALIVLDEPTVGLDPMQISEIRQLIKQLSAEHGVILSTHILSEVQEMCTHLQMIQKGQFILQDSLSALNLRTSTHRLKLVTRQPIDCPRLLEMNGVTEIQILAPTEYCIYYQPDTVPTESISALVIGAGWGLEQIIPVQRSIEEIFIELSQARSVPKP